MYKFLLCFAIASSCLGQSTNDLDYRERWAVVIGIDTYDEARNGLRPLQFAENDAREFGDILQDEFGYGSVDGQTHVRYLVNGEATKENVEKAFTEWLPARGVQADDAVLVFFAGHDLTDDAGAGYLAAVNSKASDLTSCISVEWLRDQLRRGDRQRFPARHRLIILDCCYSGSLFRKLPPEPAVPRGDDAAAEAVAPQIQPSQTRDARRINRAHDDEQLRRWLAKDAFQGISAGRSNEPVADGQGRGRHSVFTAALLEVLRERADSRRRDHVFTFRALAAQVYSRVSAVLKVSQTPEFGYLDAESDGDFVLRPTTRRSTPSERLEAGRLASLSSLNRARDFSAACLLADKAIDVADTFDARDSVLSALLLHPRLDQTIAVSTQRIRSAEFSPDGVLIACGGNDGVLRVYDAHTTALRHTLKGHAKEVNSLCFLGPERLGSAGQDGQIILWNLATGALERTFSPHGTGGVKVARPGKRPVLFSSGGDGTVCRIDPASGEVTVVARAGRKQGPDFLAVNSDETCVAVTRQNSTIYLYDTKSGKETTLLHRNVRSVAFHPTKGWLASAGSESSDDGNPAVSSASTLMLWDVGQRKSLLTLHDEENAISALAFSASGEYVVASGNSGKILGWRLDSTGKSPPTASSTGPPLEHGAWISALAFRPDSARLLSTGWDGRVKIWNVEPNPNMRPALPMPADSELQVRIAPGVGSVSPRKAPTPPALWDHNAWCRLGAVVPIVGEVSQCEFSPRGGLMALRDASAIRILDAEQPYAEGAVLQGRKGAFAWLNDGESLVVDAGEGKLEIVSSSGAKRAVLAAGTHRIRRMFGSQKGGLLANDDAGSLRYWPSVAEPGRVLTLIDRGVGLRSAAFSRDDGALVIGFNPLESEGAELIGKGEIQLWQLSPSPPRFVKSVSRDLHSAPGSLALDRAQTVLSAWFEAGDTIKCYDIAGDEAVDIGCATLIPRLGGLDAILRSDLPVQASLGQGGIALWDRDTKQYFGAALNGHTGRIRGLRFNADGQRLITFGGAPYVIIWDVSPATWKSRLRRVISGTLSPEDALKFGLDYEMQQP